MSPNLQQFHNLRSTKFLREGQAIHLIQTLDRVQKPAVLFDTSTRVTKYANQELAKGKKEHRDSTGEVIGRKYD
jgi:hypothetical protein